MEYLFTERAHLMCPNMCFGIVATVNRFYDEARIRESFEQLSLAHPFLNALLGYEEEKNLYYYDVTKSSQIAILFGNSQIAGIDAPEVLETYRRLTGRDWDLTREGMLKAAIWKAAEKTVFLLVFHHLLADGRGALGLMQELADYYVHGSVPKFAQEKLISSTGDFPANSRMPLISRTLVGKANKDWAKEKHRVSYEEYHAFADRFLQEDVVKHSVSIVRKEKLAVLLEKCHANHVSVNDYLLARMFRKDGTGKIIMACDLRDQLACYQKGALGNYSTAFSVEIKKKEKDVFTLAKAVHERIQKIMNTPADLYLVLQCYAELDPGILDAALISCSGNFKSKAGQFIGNMFFGFGAPEGYSITNLGKIESDSIAAAYFIPPASPAIKKTQGILTVNGEMRICTSER